MSDDWLSQLDEPPAAEVLARSDDDEDDEFFRDLQATLYQQAAKITEDAMSFSEIDPASDVPPDRWIALYGIEEATRKLRIARAAWMSAKEAPVGLQIAHRQVLGIMKAKATEEAAPRTLAITLVQGAPSPQFPEKVIETDKSKRY